MGVPGRCTECGATIQLRQSTSGMSYLVCSRNVSHRGIGGYGGELPDAEDTEPQGQRAA